MNTATQTAAQTGHVDSGQDVIRSLAGNIYDIIKEGRKADSAAANTAEHLLVIARKAETLRAFNEAVKLAEIQYKAKFKGEKIPKAFQQARTNIRRWMNLQIPFIKVEKLESGEMRETPRSYYQMGKAERALKDADAKAVERQAKTDAEEAMKANPGRAALDAIVTLIQSEKRMNDADRLEAASILRDFYNKWKETAPPEVVETVGTQDGDDLEDLSKVA